MAPKRNTKRPRTQSSTDPDAGKIPCTTCNGRYSRQGITAHMTACAKKQGRKAQDAAYREKLWDKVQRPAEKRPRTAGEPSTSQLGASSAAPYVQDEHDVIMHAELQDENSTGSTAEMAVNEPAPISQGPVDRHVAAIANESSAMPQPVVHEIDDIRTEYHPQSKKRVKVEHFEDYGCDFDASSIPIEQEPWKPFFPSHNDFSFAKLLLEARLNHEHCEQLIKLIHTFVEGGPGSFNVTNFADLKSMWDRASEKLTPFQKCKIKASYRHHERAYDFHYRPLWDYATDLLSQPQLAPHFVWDAEKLFKFDGEDFVRFVHEPWTGDDFWKIQNNLPAGGKPLCFILYADKAKLSSFGGVKGYPIVARCANLPVNIRNGEGVGGGCVVGWLPIVPESKLDGGKTDFVNFKRAIWHKSFYVLLESIAAKSKTGCWYECADGIKRFLFPCIIILSADYEEQCVMALTRGVSSLYPCPICLVPQDLLSDLSMGHPLRTAENSQSILNEARNQETLHAREEKLKEYSLRDVDNAFWSVSNSDPHRALSFDRLHAYNAGLFEDHLWPEFKACLDNLGQPVAVKFEEQIDLCRRWSGLNHFSQVLKTSYADATKYEDIGKLTVYTAFSLIPRIPQQRGGGQAWLLLRCLRSYAMLDTYVAFEVHTEKTIIAGRRELQRFGKLVKQYTEGTTYSTKTWNFPKMHTQQHAFDDFMQKGVSRNFNTKPNEKLHRPLRLDYNKTNFKNVAPQILEKNHHFAVANLIQERIDDLDEHKKALKKQANNISAPGPQIKKTRRFTAGHTVLGSRQPSCTFQALEDSNSTDEAFQDFRTRLGPWLTDSLQQYNIPLPNGPVTFHEDDQITLFQFLKVTYESTVDWRSKTDNLHCSPLFHGHPRNDFIILDTAAGNIFAQLQSMFTCQVDGTEYALVLAVPLDAPIGAETMKDKELELLRVRTRPRASAEFFFARSIIRGALLVDAYDKDGDYFVVDVVDTDMFLRIQTIYKDLHSQ